MLYSILFYRVISGQGALMDSELYSIVNCVKYISVYKNIENIYNPQTNLFIVLSFL